ncbi:hypothetical protein [uncultured Bilophila sp.]|uniref:hypothetical protein n=1 Tax=uncultured Bilophila sp. TaxID=529385 RepID=UPI00280AD8F3|nr:hypothetical protein [uncultured Bilophila sp.]
MLPAYALLVSCSIVDIRQQLIGDIEPREKRSKPLGASGWKETQCVSTGEHLINLILFIKIKQSTETAVSATENRSGMLFLFTCIY